LPPQNGHGSKFSFDGAFICVALFEVSRECPETSFVIRQFSSHDIVVLNRAHIPMAGTLPSVANEMPAPAYRHTVSGMFANCAVLFSSAWKLFRCHLAGLSFTLDQQA
jgi:hypothetical protein